jgi:formylglycine-generating enzyme required for sulfatase activity
MVDAAQQRIEVFFSYSRKDESLRKELDNHLAVLKRQAVITSWYDRQIEGGSEWEKEIARHMQTADIILLLVSSDFIASEYCYVKELPKAIARHQAGEACVIPILLRPIAYWEEMPFAHLQVYPSGGLPITRWDDRDSAFVDVVQGINTAVKRLIEKRQEKLRQEQERERLRLEAIRQQRLEQERREAQAKEQARLAEQARIREAEQQAEQQRREVMRAAEARRAEEETRRSREAQQAQEAKRLEEARQAAAARQKEQARQTVTRSYPTLPPPGIDRDRRKVLQWLGLGSAGMFVAGLAGQEALKRGRSSTPSPSASPSNASLPDLEDFSFEVATVNKQGQEAPRQTMKAKHFVENLGNSVTLQMVAIPGGTFQMGSPTTEKSRYSGESPQHSVNVSAFSIGRYPVTQAQYEAVMGKNPSHFKGAKRPVEQVSWNDAQEFCKKLSQKTGRTYRLPSEAEWEYACRAKTTTPFHFGETMTSALANYDATVTYQSEPKGEYREQTTDVGIFPANAFGLCDMHGNVWEWCEDIYHKNYEGAPTDGSAWNVGGESNIRVLRGGSWIYNPRVCRSAARSWYVAGIRYLYFGFRVVCSAPRT